MTEVARVDSRLPAVRELIADRLGLHFPPERTGDLRRSLEGAARLAGQRELGAYLDSLLVAPVDAAQLKELAAALTIGETYFFRDPKVFDLLADRFFPAWSTARGPGGGHLRAWSAGCCTGEEAYSLAIAFDRVRAALPGCELDLLATDLNPRFLRQARAATYRPWSFRGAPAWLEGTYFEPCGEGRVRVREDIRQRVRFSELNLADGEFPAVDNRTCGLDLILCRHVLMYFTPAQFARAVHRLARCLAEGGWLMVSAAEAGLVSDPLLAPAQLGGVTVLVRTSGRTRVPAAGDGAGCPRAVGSLGENSWIQPAPPAVAVADRPGAGEPLPLPAAGRAEGASNPARSRAMPPVAAGEARAEALAELRALASRGALAAALAACDRWLQRDKLDATAHFLRAAILLEQGAAEAAEVALKRVLFLDPDFVAAHLALANLARRRARGPEARRHLRNALTLARRLAPDRVLPETDGLAAGRLVAMVSPMLDGDPALEGVVGASGRAVHPSAGSAPRA